MELSTVNQYFGNIDIYLLDQILKGKFKPGMKVFDAGCGEGRNLMYFLNSGHTVHGLDIDPEAVRAVRFIAAAIRPDLDKDFFMEGNIQEVPYPDKSFDLIIASAVLHFARNADHFYSMFRELIRCLKPGGMLFVRMTSDIGIENKVVHLGSGIFKIPDGSKRFLLTPKILKILEERHHLKYLEPLKTVNVNSVRCMSTLIVTIN